MKRFVAAIAGLAVVIVAISWLAVRQTPSFCRMVTITTPNGTSISAETATTPAAQAKGLSGRASLPEHHGMLFIFSKPDYYSFWMKNTLIPLDIIWLNNKQVVDMISLPASTLNAPESTIPIYHPSHMADRVLEINQGEANQLGIRIGSKLTWPGC